MRSGSVFRAIAGATKSLEISELVLQQSRNGNSCRFRPQCAPSERHNLPAALPRLREFLVRPPAFGSNHGDYATGFHVPFWLSVRVAIASRISHFQLHVADRSKELIQVRRRIYEH